MSNLEALDISSLQTKEDVMNFISEVEKSAMQMTDHHAEIPVKHHFSKDVYAREIRIPKGAVVIGKIHKFENFNILSEGELLLISIDGIQHVKAPFSVVSSPGVKRLAIAVTDAVWTTIHGTTERDIEKIEEKYIAKSYADVPLLGEVVKIEGE